MTIDETKKAIEVMQAFVDGKEIECNYSGGDRWAGAPVPSWAWDAFVEISVALPLVFARACGVSFL